MNEFSGYIIDWGGQFTYWFKELEEAKSFARLWKVKIITPTQPQV